MRHGIYIGDKRSLYDDDAMMYYDDDARRSSRRQLRGFLFMALMFALNHGAAVACLSFAVAELGPRVGNASSGSLYLSFMCCALFAAAGCVRELGAKGAFRHIVCLTSFRRRLAAVSPSRRLFLALSPSFFNPVRF